MTEWFDRVLSRYGREITVIHGTRAAEARAFIQLRTDASDAAPYAVTSLGTADDRRWQCLTRAALADGDTVVCGGVQYRVATCGAVYAGRELSHWWGILTREREAGA